MLITEGHSIEHQWTSGMSSLPCKWDKPLGSEVKVDYIFSFCIFNCKINTHTICYVNHFKVYISVALSAFTVL